MPGPFDTTTRYLVETYPADWLSFLGFDPDGPIEVIDAKPLLPGWPARHVAAGAAGGD